MGLLDISSWFRRNRSDLVYERTLDDKNWYFIEDDQNWSVDESNLQYALRNPILTPALLFLSNLFAQAQFKVVDKETQEVIKDHPLTKLLNDPNYYQSRIDFLESAEFLKISQGRVGIWKKKIIGFNDEIDQLYLLRSDLITFPKGFKTKAIFEKSRDALNKVRITYDKEGQNIKIPLGDITWLYDMPNVSNKRNFFDNESRITGLHQTLRNVTDTQLAKNIIIKTNGKEMISGDSTNSFPFGGEEQKAAKQIFNDQLGLGFGRSRLWMTKAKVTHKNLTVAMRDLGHDESTKVDGNLIYTALHIPKDILSLEAKKTTYNNFKESMTSFIQNDIQSQANDFTEAFASELEEGEELVASYDHLPVMQFIEIEKYEALQGRAKALNDLLATGIPQEEALELTGFPKNLKLNEREPINPTAPANQSQRSQENDGSAQEMD